MVRERDMGYGGWDPSGNRDRDYSTRRRGGEMELYDRERERERTRVNIRDKREYSPRYRGGGGYERMSIDGKYSRGRGGGEFEMQRMKGKEEGGGDFYREPPSERFDRDFNRHSDVIDRKYTQRVVGGEFDRPRRQDKEEERRLGGAPPDRLSRDFNRHSDFYDRKYTSATGGGEFDMPRRPYKEEERRLGGAPPERLSRDFNRHSDAIDRKYTSGLEDGEFERPRRPNKEEEIIHLGGAPPPERLRKPSDRHSNIVDTQKDYSGALLQSYRGPVNGSRNEGYPSRSYQFNEDLSRVDRVNLPVDEHRKPDSLKASTDHFTDGLSSRVDRWNHPLDEHKKPSTVLDGSGVSGEKDYFSRRYLGKYPSDQLLDNNNNQEKNYSSSSYPLDVNVPPPKSYSINDGNSYGLPPAYPGTTSVQKGKIYHLDGDPYLKDNYYVGPSVLPKEGLSSSEMMLNKQPIQYDGYGEKTLTKSSDIRSYPRSYPIPSEEKREVYAYPGEGEDYSHTNMLKATSHTSQDPILGKNDQFSRGERIRGDGRTWDNHHSYTSSKNYVDGIGSSSSYVRRDYVDALDYGEYERKVYKQPREAPIYSIGQDSWSNLEYHSSPSRKLSGEDLDLPEPSRRKVIKRKSHDIPTSSKDKIVGNDDDGKTSKKSRNVISRLTPRNPSSRDIKSRLGPRHVVNERPSVKKRLGPRVQNVRGSEYVTKKYRLMKRLGPVVQ